MKDVTDEMIRLREIKELIFLLRENIDPRKPWRRGITRIKRETEVIISLTSYPARINSTHKTIRTLLHQKYLPACRRAVSRQNRNTKRNFGIAEIWTGDSLVS